MTDLQVRQSIDTARQQGDTKQYLAMCNELRTRKANFPHKFRVIVDGEENAWDDSGYDSLSEALAAVSYDQLEMYQIWKGDVLVVDHD